jgi:FG-GAP-like repeat/Abnormal spindle-like microcephaly-assoc'd, ASPM-SPD-2-Hydin
MKSKKLYVFELFILVIIFACPLFGQFETRASLTVQTYPYRAAVGDFNRDGNLDLAVVSGCCPSGGVSILLGNGDGTFRTAVDYPAGVSPESVVAADFNHDGILDLAVASQSTYVSILLGNGDGTFQAATETPAVPDFERYMTTGDFNHDGKPDLVMRADQSAITVLLGNGDGTFQNALTTYAPFYISALGVGDFNHDGKLDLVTAGTFGSASSVDIWLGNGDGTFDYGATYSGGEVPEAIAVADFNRDGKLDLAINDSEGTGIAVMLGNGDGTFQDAVNYPVAFNNWVTAADFNGDGKLDLAVPNGFPLTSITVFPGNGDGTFGTGISYPAGGDAYYVAVGDFNGDGKLDMAIPDHQHSDVIVMLNTGTLSLSPTSPLTFKKQAVGSKSAPQTVTLTNSGKTQLKFSSLKVSSQFGMTTTCHPNMAVGTKCTISVTFTPKSQGVQAGTLTIMDSASSKPMVVELSGTGD